jgi:hypothetical protein
VMSAWPDTLKVGPIREWPGSLTAASSRKAAPFRATLNDTLKVLDREIYQLVETPAQQNSTELLVAIPAGGFRLDGRPRADARAEHPGVIFSLDSPHGHLSYPCDTYTAWQDNLRAIALALEALRKVDRYGVTRRGEQYRGFLAIEATAAPAGFGTVEDAAGFVRAMSGERPDVTDREGMARAVRLAKRHTHPDTAGGSADAFQKVSLAEGVL